MIQIPLPPTRFDWNFRLLKIPVRVMPLFWLITILISYNWIGSVSAYYHESPVAHGLLTIFCTFFSILLHEYGHALSCNYFGGETNEVVLYHMGGLCFSDSDSLSRWQRIKMLLWGPGAGFVLGLLAFGCKFALELSFKKPLDEWPESLRNIALYCSLLIQINLAWGLLNLVPVFPLDGGQILRESLLWRDPHRDEAGIFLLFVWLGGGAALLMLVLHFIFPSITLFAPFLFGALAFQNWQVYKQVKEMGGMFGGEDHAPRQPWEQKDDNWWQK